MNTCMRKCKLHSNCSHLCIHCTMMFYTNAEFAQTPKLFARSCFHTVFSCQFLCLFGIQNISYTKCTLNHRKLFYSTYYIYIYIYIYQIKQKYYCRYFSSRLYFLKNKTCLSINKVRNVNSQMLFVM